MPRPPGPDEPSDPTRPHPDGPHPDHTRSDQAQPGWDVPGRSQAGQPSADQPQPDQAPSMQAPTDPVGSDEPRHDPTQYDQTSTDQAQSDQDRSDQSQSDQGQSDQTGSDQDRYEPKHPDHTGHHQTGHQEQAGWIAPGSPRPGDAGPGDDHWVPIDQPHPVHPPQPPYPQPPTTHPAWDPAAGPGVPPTYPFQASPPGAYPHQPHPPGTYPPQQYPTQPAGPLPEQPAAVPLRPMAFNDLLSATLDVLRREGRTMYLLTLAGCGIMLLFAVLVASWSGPSEEVPITETQYFSEAPSAIWSVLLTAITIPLIGLLSYPVVQGAIGRRAGPAETWRRTAWSLPSLLGVAALSLLLAAILAGIPLILLLTALTAASIGGMLLTLGISVVTLILALWLSLRLAPALPAIVAERCSPVAGLGRAWRLTRPHQGRLGFLLLVFIVAGVLGAVAGTIFEQIVEVAVGGSLETTFGATLLLLCGDIVGSLVSIPILAAAITLHYLDLRIREEAYGVVLGQAAVEVAAGAHSDGWSEPAAAGPPQ